MAEIISIGITLVPERIHMARALKAALLDQNPDAHISFYTDSARSGVWANTERAWSDYDRGCGYRMILQEDTLPCPNFFNYIHEILTVMPDHIISLYSGWSDRARFNKAIKMDVHWYKFRVGMTGQGVLMPTSFILPFLRWTDKHISRAIKKNCDDRVIAWMLSRDTWAWQTIPELIRHVGGNQSTLGFSTPTKHEYIIADGSNMDWTKGSDGKVTFDGGADYFDKWMKKWYIP